MNSPKLGIVIVNYNGLNDTLKCLASLKKQSGRHSLIIVVDNASKEDPSAVVPHYPEVVLIKRQTNGGWAGGNNTGINYAIKSGCNNIILLNNDTVVSENFVERMILAANNNLSFGVLGPLVYSMEKPNEVTMEGTLFNRPGYNGFFPPQHIGIRISDMPKIEETDLVNGCCLMAREEVFNQIGLIDERFFLLHEESDFCLRAKEKGWKCGIIAEPLLWHKGAATFNRSEKSLRYYYGSRNLWLLLKKHAGKTQKSRGWLASILQYLRYTHYMCCLAKERGSKSNVAALIDGISDGWMGRFGPKNSHGYRLVNKIVAIFLSLNFFVAAILGSTYSCEISDDS